MTCSTSASVISGEEQFEDYGESEDVEFTPSSPCPEEDTRTNGFSDLGSSLPSRWGVCWVTWECLQHNQNQKKEPSTILLEGIRIALCACCKWTYAFVVTVLGTLPRRCAIFITVSCWTSTVLSAARKWICWMIWKPDFEISKPTGTVCVQHVEVMSQFSFNLPLQQQ